MMRLHPNSSLGLIVAMLSLAPGAAEAQNLIRAENEKPGTTDWLLTKIIKKGPIPTRYAPENEPYEKGWRRRKQIEGYTSHTSIKAGDTLKIFVSTEPASPFTVDIYRMGYYGGKGARHMRRVGPFEGSPQPTPEDGERNLRECRWGEACGLKIPAEWLSGVYLGRLAV